MNQTPDHVETVALRQGPDGPFPTCPPCDRQGRTLRGDQLAHHRHDAEPFDPALPTHEAQKRARDAAVSMPVLIPPPNGLTYGDPS